MGNANKINEPAFKIVCDVCQIWFIVAADFREQKIRDTTAFYCPNGHAIIYDRRKAAKDAVANFNQANQKLDRKGN